MIRGKILNELQHMVSPTKMMDACDIGGISRRGYEAMYRILTLTRCEKGVLRPMLPTPYSVILC